MSVKAVVARPVRHSYGRLDFPITDCYGSSGFNVFLSDLSKERIHSRRTKLPIPRCDGGELSVGGAVWSASGWPGKSRAETRAQVTGRFSSANNSSAQVLFAPFLSA